MSTKSSLASGKTFHLFEEAFDPTHRVHLDLDGCDFEATPQGIRVEIPLAIWEVIRQHTPARFDLAPLTAAQLRAEAEKRVNAVRADYETALAEGHANRQEGGKKHWVKHRLPLLQFDATLPREEHLALVLKTLRAERSAQRKLQREIARLSPQRGK